MRPIYIYLLLVAVGIPWWWPKQDTTILFGMPAWVISAVAVSFIASVYTLFVIINAWPPETDE